MLLQERHGSPSDPGGQLVVTAHQMIPKEDLRHGALARALNQAHPLLKNRQLESRSSYDPRLKETFSEGTVRTGLSAVTRPPVPSA